MTQPIQIVGNPPADAIERQAAIVRAVKPLLAGNHPAVQGAVLAELLALWLAGHQVESAMHDELLTLHVATVRELLPVAQAEIDALIRQAAAESPTP